MYRISWKDVEVSDLIIFPSALETLKIYVVGQNCPPVLWNFQVQRTDPARVERNTTQVWHLKEV